MRKLTELVSSLSLRDDKVSLKTLCLLLLVAFVFSVALRMIWVYQFSDVGEFYWNDQLMINTNDGYYWAEGARDILEENENRYIASPVTRGLPMITAFFAKVLPFISFETLIFYLPAALGSLLVAPILLIGRAMNHTYAGFCAALIGSIAWSYYNRTMVGYYDDDMLTIVLPTTVLFALVMGLYRAKIYYLPIVTLLTALSYWYYPQSSSLLSAVAAMLLIYTLIFHRKNLYNYQLLGFMLLGLLALKPITIVCLVIAAMALFILAKERFSQVAVFGFLLATITLALFFGPFGVIVIGLQNYVWRTATSAVESNSTALSFFNVVQTVREASEIDFGLFASRISGHWTLFLLACVGTAMMMIRHRALLIALPFVGLGFLAYGIPGYIPPAGLRFTIYAVPVMALGLAYLIFWLSELISDRRVSYALAALLGAGALYPHIDHIIDYRVPTVFNSYEVSALDEFAKKIERGRDYAISWWDYGYPIRYYSYANTLIDGGRHDGGSNFATSFILTTTSDTAAARLARLAVEVDRGFAREFNGSSPIGTMMAYYSAENPATFLRDLADKNEMMLPGKTRETYLVLPFRMGEVFGTVMRFSSLDLVTGRQYPPPLFIPARGFSDDGAVVQIGNGMRLEKQSGTLVNGTQRIAVKHVFVTGQNDQGQFFSMPQTFSQSGNVSLIFMTHLNSVWIVDDVALNSVYVRMFALRSYNPSLFEPIVASPLMMIYRLKI